MNEFSAAALTERLRADLCVEPQAGGRLLASLRYEGRTCSWGRLSIHALMRAILIQAGDELVFEKGWVELPVNDAGTHFMCERQRQAAALLEGLGAAPQLAGLTLRAILSRPAETNALPCFCRPPMVEHKWRLFAATLLLWQQGAVRQAAA